MGKRFCRLVEMLAKSVEGNLISGFRVGDSTSRVFEISYFLFSDDTLMLFGANPDQIRYLKCFLLARKVFSGLKVNLGKSELFQLGGAGVANVASIFVVGWDLFLQILGMLLDSSSKNKSCMG